MIFRSSAIPKLWGFGGLVSIASAAALVERQLYCPPGSALTELHINTTVVLTPIVINQFYGSNTIINIAGGVTININNAPTLLVTTVTASTTISITSTVTTTASVTVTDGGLLTSIPATADASVTTSTPSSPALPTTAGTGTLPTPFVLQVNTPGIRKRQAGAGLFIGGSGSVYNGCSSATAFTLSNFQLFGPLGIISTSPGVDTVDFGVPQPLGSITTSFQLVNGQLFWLNDIFSGGAASFCLDTAVSTDNPNGTVSAHFRPNPQPCIPVTLTTLSASDCPVQSSDGTAQSTSRSSISGTSNIPSSSQITGQGSSASVRPSSGVSSGTITSATNLASLSSGSSISSSQSTATRTTSSSPSGSSSLSSTSSRSPSSSSNIPSTSISSSGTSASTTTRASSSSSSSGSIATSPISSSGSAATSSLSMIVSTTISTSSLTFSQSGSTASNSNLGTSTTSVFSSTLPTSLLDPTAPSLTLPTGSLTSSTGISTTSSFLSATTSSTSFEISSLLTTTSLTLLTTSSGFSSEGTSTFSGLPSTSIDISTDLTSTSLQLPTTSLEISSVLTTTSLVLPTTSLELSSLLTTTSLDLPTTSLTLSVDTTSTSLELPTTSLTLSIDTSSVSLELPTTSLTLSIDTTSISLELPTTSSDSSSNPTSTLSSDLSLSSIDIPDTSSTSIIITSLFTSATSTNELTSATSSGSATATCTISLAQQTNDVAFLLATISGGAQSLLNALPLQDLTSGTILGPVLTPIQDALNDVVACGLTTASDLQICVTDTTNLVSAQQFTACLLAGISDVPVTVNAVFDDLTGLITAATAALGSVGMTVSNTVGDIANSAAGLVGNLLNGLLVLLGAGSSTPTPTSTSAPTASCTISPAQQSDDVTLLLATIQSGGQSLLNSISLDQLGSATIVGAVLSPLEQALKDVVACGLTTASGLQVCVTNPANLVSAQQFTACLVAGLSQVPVAIGAVAADLSTLLNAAGLAVGTSLGALTGNDSIGTISNANGIVGAILRGLLNLLGITTPATTTSAPSATISASPTTTCNVSPAETLLLTNIVSGGAQGILGLVPVIDLQSTATTVVGSVLPGIETALKDVVQCGLTTASVLQVCVTDTSNLISNTRFLACLINALSPVQLGVDGVLVNLNTIITGAGLAVATSGGSLLSSDTLGAVAGSNAVVSGLLQTLLSLLNGQQPPATSSTTSTSPAPTCAVSSGDTGILNDLLVGTPSTLLNSLSLSGISTTAAITDPVLLSIRNALQATVACGLTTASQLQICVTNAANLQTSQTFAACLLNQLAPVTSTVGAVAGSLQGIVSLASGLGANTASTISSVIGSNGIIGALVQTLINLLTGTTTPVGTTTTTATTTTPPVATSSGPAPSATCAISTGQQATDAALLSTVLSETPQTLLVSLSIGNINTGAITGTLLDIETALQNNVACGITTASNLLPCVTTASNLANSQTFAACLLNQLAPVKSTVPIVASSLGAIVTLATTVGGATSASTIGSLTTGVAGTLIQTLLNLLNGVAPPAATTTTTSAITTTTTTTAPAAPTCAISASQLAADATALTQLNSLPALVSSLTINALSGNIGVNTPVVGPIFRAISDLQTCGTLTNPALATCINPASVVTTVQFVACILSTVSPLKPAASLVSTALNTLVTAAKAIFLNSNSAFGSSSLLTATIGTVLSLLGV